MYGIDFYPTSPKTLQKLLGDIDFRTINTALEPNAGDGAIAEYIREKTEKINSYKKYSADIDCVEIDSNLRYILQGKSFRVIHDDFLTYNTLKSYDLIAMNPPFNNQEYHIKKALGMLLLSGGILRAITNAEMIKNPYSNIRKEIINILNNNNAIIEFHEGEFSEARRETDVEIAIIKCKIERKEIGSIIVDNLKQAEEENESEYRSQYIVGNDLIKAIVQQYNFEAQAGVKLIEEYKKLESFTRSDFNEGSNILDLKIHGDKGYSDTNVNRLKNDYLKKLRYKYWKALFNNKEFTKLFTSNLQRDFYNKLDALSEYEFSEFNIQEVRIQLNNQVANGVKECIMGLFDDFSHKHYWDKNQSSNIHYFNGWATNSCYKINKKVIIRLDGFQRWDGDFDPTYYGVIDKLLDIEKVFNYLSSGRAEEIDLREVMEKAKNERKTKGIMTKYFKVDFMKKGSCHLSFLDLELLKKFNIFGASNKEGWLPPSYAKKSYSEMSKREQEVIDNFENEKEYNKVMEDKDYYIYDTSDILMLA